MGKLRVYRRIASTDSGNITLASVSSTKESYRVQRIFVFIITSAASVLQFKGSTSGKVIFQIDANPGNNTQWEYTPGDRGIPLAAGDSLQVNVSVAGLVADVYVEGLLEFLA
ncbi:MAG: hypothetical protein QXE45_04505 [Thermoplasmata archaeon]